MQIIEMRLSDIRPYENNPRHNDEAVQFVANSIYEFGFKVPMVVDKDGTIVTGHTRYKAAKLLGYDTVPVIMADDLTPEQIKAFRIADNKVGEIATWDMEALETELEDLEGIEWDMTGFGFVHTDIDWDDVPELTEESYDAPQHDMIRCPACGHIDRKEHFIKQASAEE